MQITDYGRMGYYGAPAYQAYANGGVAAAAARTADQPGSDTATVVTLSEAARAANAKPDFAAVVNAARKALNVLLADAARTSPLKDGQLALDMGSLDHRELFAISTTRDGVFSSDERKAADLEIDRRFGQALSGPAAVSEITGDYRVLYSAAATHLDGMSEEQKAEPEWQAARAAIARALTALATDPSVPPSAIEGDPVALWLERRAVGQEDGGTTDPATLAENLRSILDKRYEAATGAGSQPTFNKSRPGYFIDLSEFESRAISTMALNGEGLFSASEVLAANAEIKQRANTALSEGYKDAMRSGDPTAFSRNIISIYSSMSPEERQASGLSENLLNTAIASYQSTVRLADMMAAGMNAASGMKNWFSL